MRCKEKARVRNIRHGQHASFCVLLRLRVEFVRHVFAAELSEEDRARILDYGLRALAGENPID